MNNQITFPNTVPLHYDSTGTTIRVKGSRVTLDTLVIRFQQGDTLLEIAEGFPSLSMEEITAVIDWYLNHQNEADPYLEQGQIEAERLRLEIQSQPGYAEFREELRRRRARRNKS